ncbi:CLUMA_CG016925, isoform A [Clunio marinus]|uniref:CLUMA_CG016925, isoform A n=1 Tax=Clunio marinus TaxID=568069 RepID=A0A1J1ITD6_9DIPT|nr:CLUMA_CG016925, isoform A [Clunio marinus]
MVEKRLPLIMFGGDIVLHLEMKNLKEQHHRDQMSKRQQPVDEKNCNMTTMTMTLLLFEGWEEKN